MPDQHRLAGATYGVQVTGPLRAPDESAIRRLVIGTTAAAVLLIGCSAAGARADEQPSPEPVAEVAPVQEPTSAPAFPLRIGDQGPAVASAQRRLIWLGAHIDRQELAGERFGRTTRSAVHAFQEKFLGSRNGQLGRTTWNRLRQIAGRVDVLPAACDRHKALCIDMSQRVLRYVVDGQAVLILDARFGMPGNATARGTFRVRSKSRNHVSTLYRTSMPYAMFFHGDQAVHYSPYFARDGYDGGSHGCVNLRDRKAAAWLFDHVPIGTTVYVAD